MLNIYSSKDKIGNKEYIRDVEAKFKRVYKRDTNIYTSNLAKLALSQIEGATDINGGSINTRFGYVDISVVSTSCKGVLLALSNSNLAVSNIEMGNNAINTLMRLSRQTDTNLALDLSLRSMPSECGNDTVSFDGNIMLLKDLFKKLLDEEIQYQRTLGLR